MHLYRALLTGPYEELVVCFFDQWFKFQLVLLLEHFFIALWQLYYD